MSHPLIALAADKDVRQAAAFRAHAEKLTGAQLAEAYEQEKREAPHLHDAGKRYLAPRGGKPATERKSNKDEEHAAAALVRYGLARGDGLPLPDATLRLLPRAVDRRDHDHVGRGERAPQRVAVQRGARVEMRLKHRHQASSRIRLPRGRQRGRHFRRVVRVVVHDVYAARRPEPLEAATYSTECRERRRPPRRINA